MNRRLRSVVNFLGWCAATIALVLLIAVVAGTALCRQYERRAAQVDLTKMDQVPERSEIVDTNGEHYTYFGGENRFVVPLYEVSKNFINALLAREDSRFWEHEGVDLLGVVRAAVTNARSGETKQGASTITQQLARNVADLKARTLDRKALEAMLARRIEKENTKEQILELYVNRIYFGSGYYGIETASRGYFGKHASELTLGEGAALAGLIRSPGRLSPANDLDASVKERNEVIDRMQELKMVTADEAAAARAQQLTLAKQNKMRVADDYVSDAVLRELSNLLAPETLEYGGLKVHMTIDPQLQRLAQEAADRRLTEVEEQKGYPHPKKKDYTSPAEGEEEKPTAYIQAAAVVVDNRSGAIRAVVGGRDYQQSKYSRALLSRRQIGSTFKPFVYAAAFEHGMLPGTMVDDSKIAPGEFRDIPKKWSPENSDGEYNGPQPAAVGLIKSRNTMSVRVGEFAGLSRVRQLGLAAGISDKIPDLPVVFLGGFETTVRELTSAYTIFPNLGTYRKSHLISQIEDRDGRTLYKPDSTENRVVAPNSAWLVSSVLQEVMKSGTAAKSASLGWKKAGAGKTGTTNDFHDAWFVGYTSSLTCGVWVGMDQPQTILEKGYGSALALPIWVDIMQNAPENLYPAGPLQPPEQMVTVSICSVSGARATASCVAHKTAYQMQLPVSGVPKSTCQTHPEPAVQPVVLQQPIIPGESGVATEPIQGQSGQAAVAAAPPRVPTSSTIPTPQPTPIPFSALSAPRSSTIYPGEVEVPGYSAPTPVPQLSAAAQAAEAESAAIYRRSRRGPASPTTSVVPPAPIGERPSQPAIMQEQIPSRRIGGPQQSGLSRNRQKALRFAPPRLTPPRMTHPKRDCQTGRASVELSKGCPTGEPAH